MLSQPDFFSQEKEWILYSDESIQKGLFYSNFFGGALVRASQIHRIETRLATAASAANLTSEVKWNKLTEQWLSGYQALVDVFFDEISSGNIRVRVMFRQNSWVGPELSSEQKANSYFLLYYQFVKHAFGFGSLRNPHPIRLRLYFDQFPHKRELVERFRTYITRMFQSIGTTSGLLVSRDSIAEIRSHDHWILQVLDVTLGSMAFRLNDGHLYRIEGQRAIPKRTKARITLYEHILNKVRTTVHPRFNVGVSTATPEGYRHSWSVPYAHWAFVPKGAVHHPGVGKVRTKKEPHTDLLQGPT